MLLPEKQLIHCCVTGQDGFSWFFTPCYGRPQRIMREDMWKTLIDLCPSIKAPWLVAGDFNSILFSHEIMGAMSDRRACSSFRDCVARCNFLDVGFQVPAFTWKRGNLRERLDRALFNEEWVSCFEEVGVVICPCITQTIVRYGFVLVLN